MSNRRERRAQARASATTKDEVPLRQPSRDASNHKTLLDIASERQILNTASQSSYPSITTTKIDPDGSLSTTSSASEVPDTTTPYLDILLYTATLTMLHFTLTLLVHHQYATTPPSLGSILYTSTVASPTPALIFVLVSTLHPRSPQLFAQILFAFLSVAAGAWLVHASNEDAYMAVMKKAPPLGTLWVWSIVEMRWEWAVGCLGVVAGWGWWKGYNPENPEMQSYGYGQNEIHCLLEWTLSHLGARVTLEHKLFEVTRGLLLDEPAKKNSEDGGEGLKGNAIKGAIDEAGLHVDGERVDHSGI